MEQKEIIFTFDDGPSPNNTPKILDILKRHGIKAGFFINGPYNGNIDWNIIPRILNEGHVIGNHTWEHLPNKPKSDFLKLHEEMIIHKYSELLKVKQGGNLNRLVYWRCPGGTQGLFDQIARERGYHPQTKWRYDSKDWEASRDNTNDSGN